MKEETDHKMAKNPKTAGKDWAVEESRRVLSEREALLANRAHAKEKAREETARSTILAKEKALVARAARAAEDARISAAASDQWYYLVRDQPVGPIQLSELLAKISDLLIEPPINMVWTEGMEGWKPVYEVKLLCQLSEGEEFPAAVGSKCEIDFEEETKRLQAAAKKAAEEAWVEDSIRAEERTRAKDADDAKRAFQVSAEYEATKEKAAARLEAIRHAEAKAAAAEQAQIAAEAKANAEQEARVRAEEEARLKAIADAKAAAAEQARIAAEAKANAEREAQARAEEARIKAIADAKAAAEQARIVAEAKASAEREARARAEEERIKAIAEAKVIGEKARVKAEEEARIKSIAAAEQLRIVAAAKVQAEEARIKAEEEARTKAITDAESAIEQARTAAAHKANAEKEARARAEEDARVRAIATAEAAAAEQLRITAELKANVEREVRAKAEEEARIKAKAAAEAAAAEQARIAAEAKANAEKEAQARAEEKARLDAIAQARAAAVKEAKAKALEAKKDDKIAKAKAKTEARLKARAERESAAAMKAREAEERLSTTKKPSGKCIWFYTCEGERLGPIKFAELRTMAATGALEPRLDMVWKNGMETWEYAGQIDGLFERRNTPVAAKEQVSSVPAPLHKQIHQPSNRSIKNADWPGVHRLGFSLVILVLPYVWSIVMSASSAYLTKQFGVVLVGTLLQITPFVPLGVGIYIGLRRLENLGMTWWWSFALLVPGLNLWLIYRCFACPAGYAFNKKIDLPGLMIAIIFWIGILVVTLFFIPSLGSLFDSVCGPEFRAQAQRIISSFVR